MATITGTDNQYAMSHRLRTWAPLTTTNADGNPINFASNGTGGVTFQVTGTWGVGGAMVIEGSNDGVTYFTLTDQANAALSLTANALKSVRDTPMFIRPRVTGGDGTTSLTVIAAMQKAAFST